MRADELTPGPPTDPSQPPSPSSPSPHALDPAAPPLWARRAGEWQLTLLGAAAAAAVLSLSAFALACFPGAIPDLAAPGLLAVCGGAAGLAFAALLSSWLVAQARVGVAQALEHLALASERRARGEASVFSDGDEGVGLAGAIERLQAQSFWPQPLIVVPVAALCADALVRLWPLDGTPVSGALAFGLGALALAFPVLVLERRLAAAEKTAAAAASDDGHELPDARGLAAIVRLLLATLIIAGLAGMAATAAPLAAAWTWRSLAALQIAVAAELALRGVFTLFLPAPAPGRARGCADSLLASLLVSGAHPLASLRIGLKERFHIDFGQSWALRFAAAAAGPVALGVVVVGWLLTAITILPFGDDSQRGVLERFGAPVAVLDPGIHLHLPWPFAAVRRIEDGQVHEFSLADEAQDSAEPVLARATGGLGGGTTVTINGQNLSGVTAVTFITPGPNPARSEATIVRTTPTAVTIITPAHAAGPVDVVLSASNQQAITLAGAFVYLDSDAPTPESYDRLWEKPHNSESFHLVPSPGSDQSQSFQLLNGDLRVFWRIGATPEQAIAAAYHLADPAAVVGSSVRRLVVAQLASRTVMDMVGAGRERFAGDLRSALQHDLDARGCGLEITAVAVDAIHPPTGAAAAYHSVQAAEIIATTLISAARSEAVRTAAGAESRGQETRDEGSENAADDIAKARAAANRFDADLAAYHVARDALRLERWLDVLGRTLHNADLTIIDHRLPTSTPALLDLRPSSALRRETP